MEGGSYWKSKASLFSPAYAVSEGISPLIEQIRIDVELNAFSALRKEIP